MIGETPGSYRVVARLGEGGMGAVSTAEHAALGRKAAIKLLLPNLSSNQELVRRFFNEARATATLDHLGLVQVFDVGHTATGSADIVMELLAGETVGLAGAVSADGATFRGSIRHPACPTFSVHRRG